MASDKSEYDQVKTFRNTYKDLEGVYDTFPKLCGLSGAEYWALSMIYEGITTQHAICGQLSLSRQTINSAFKQLKKRNFIYLEAMDNNLREKQVYLTEKGIKFVEEQIGYIHKLEETVWDKMENNEKKLLIKFLYKYKTLLAEELQNYKKNSNNSSEDLQSQL